MVDMIYVELAKVLKIAAMGCQIHPKRINKEINKPSTIRWSFQSSRSSRKGAFVGEPYWLGLWQGNPQNVVGEFTYHY